MPRSAGGVSSSIWQQWRWLVAGPIHTCPAYRCHFSLRLLIIALHLSLHPRLPSPMAPKRKSQLARGSPPPLAAIRAGRDIVDPLADALGRDDCHPGSAPSSAACPAAVHGPGFLRGPRRLPRRRRPCVRTLGPRGVGRSWDAVLVALLGQLPASRELPCAVMATAPPQWQDSRASAQRLAYQPRGRMQPICRAASGGPLPVLRPRPP